MKKHFGIRGKKGLFYIYVSSVLLVAIVIVFMMKNEYKFTDKQKVTETRVLAMNDLLKDIDYDSERVIYVSAFRSLIALEDYISKSGSYLNNTETMFKIAFYNGTVNGTQVDVLQNSTYSDYLSKIKLLANLVGADLEINVTQITLYHSSPWSVRVIVTARVYANDTRGMAYWDFEKNYTTEVPLQNIRDPVYSISTAGKVPNTVRHTNVSSSEFVNEATNSTVYLQMHSNNSLYIEDVLAPSFLMRLSGNFSSSPYGISSIVYLPELDTQGVSYDSSRSIVDYVLFTNITGFAENACSVQNMPVWFKIDLNHTGVYEVDNLNYTAC